jgi:glycosyltransferase involved in cell wall biosynthesis
VHPSLDIVLPCLNEAAALPWVLARIPPGTRAIVVDNESSDGSPDIARALGAEVIRCERRGYGAACHAGLQAATAELVAFCDCDATVDPADALRLAAAVTGPAHLVVGRRRPSHRAAFPLTLRLANAELARQVRRRAGVALRDVGPVRVAPTLGLRALEIEDRRSGYPVETVVRAADAGWRVTAVDVEYRPRLGPSKVTGTLLGSLRVVRDARAALAS